MKKHNTWAKHFGIWVAYTIYIYATNYVVNKNVQFFHAALFLVPYIVTFYVVLFLLNIRVRQQTLWGIAVFFIVFVLMSSLTYALIYGLLPLLGVTLYSNNDFNSFLQGAILGYAQFFAYALLYYYFSSTVRNERELRELPRWLSK